MNEIRIRAPCLIWGVWSRGHVVQILKTVPQNVLTPIFALHQRKVLNERTYLSLRLEPIFYLRGTVSQRSSGHPRTFFTVAMSIININFFCLIKLSPFSAPSISRLCSCFRFCDNGRSGPRLSFQPWGGFVLILDRPLCEDHVSCVP
jgi:hypothetical protein